MRTATLLLLLAGCAAAREPYVPFDGGDVPDAEPASDGGPPVLGDAGPPDAGPPDTPDAGPPDAGPPDAGPPDAGPPDAGPPDAGPPDAGPPDAGPPDAGPPPEPCSLCTATERCLDSVCVFDTDTRRRWILQIHHVRSQIWGAPYFAWDVQDGTQSLTTGEADVRLWVSWSDGPGGLEPLAGIHYDGQGDYEVPVVARIAILVRFETTRIGILDVDWMPYGGGPSSMGCPLGDRARLEAAAHDGLVRQSTCPAGDGKGPITYAWSLIPA
jgi:hypothetical protein